MTLTTLIERLKQYSNTWKEFNNPIRNWDYDSLFPEVDKFLKKNNFYILHSYDHESLLLEYVVYYKNEIIDLNRDKGEFPNPYWDIIEMCFKYLEDGNK